MNKKDLADLVNACNTCRAHAEIIQVLVDGLEKYIALDRGDVLNTASEALAKAHAIAEEALK